jgi:hypothetical protein
LVIEKHLVKPVQLPDSSADGIQRHRNTPMPASTLMNALLLKLLGVYLIAYQMAS